MNLLVPFFKRSRCRAFLALFFARCFSFCAAEAAAEEAAAALSSAVTESGSMLLAAGPAAGVSEDIVGKLASVSARSRRRRRRKASLF
jgi:hypothetical protein